MPRPLLSDDNVGVLPGKVYTVSLGFMPRPLLSAVSCRTLRKQFRRVAGVYAPAFVER